MQSYSHSSTFIIPFSQATQKLNIAFPTLSVIIVENHDTRCNGSHFCLLGFSPSLSGHKEGKYVHITKLYLQVWHCSHLSLVAALSIHPIPRCFLLIMCQNARRVGGADEDGGAGIVLFIFTSCRLWHVARIDEDA